MDSPNWRKRNHKSQLGGQIDAMISWRGKGTSMTTYDNLMIRRPLIVTIGIGQRLQGMQSKGLRVLNAETLEDLQSLYRNEQVAVIIFGPALTPIQIRAHLHTYNDKSSLRAIYILLFESSSQAGIQRLIDDDVFFYHGHSSLGDYELRVLVHAALCVYMQRCSSTSTKQLSSLDGDRFRHFCFTLAREHRLRDIGTLFSAEIVALLEASTARCLSYDPNRDMFRFDVNDSYSKTCDVSTGLIGYAARTGEGMRIPFATRDPRYDPNADNPTNQAEIHFIAHPIRNFDGSVFGVLTAVRSPDSEPFSVENEVCLEALATWMAPLLQMIWSELSTTMDEVASSTTSHIFRKEAIKSYDDNDSVGKPVWKIPQWLLWSHMLSVIFLSVGLAYLFLARAPEVISGPAVIRVKGKTTVEALGSGIVSEILVSRGDRVSKGDVLLRIEPNPGDSLLDRIRKEVRAPINGTVADIWIRSGQPVNAGEGVLTLSAGEGGNEAIALLPGTYAPQVHARMAIVLRIDGYPQSREMFAIHDVDAENISSNDADRYIGKETAHTLNITAPVLLVRVEVPEDSFKSSSERFAYHDGMTAHAEVRVRREPLLFTLIPGVKDAFAERRITLERGN
jgi:hypothetical protein